MDTLIATLFQSQIYAHYEHLITRSYATHMTLGSYYEAIPDLLDSLVEIYQREKTRINKPKTIDIPVFSPDSYFKGLSNYISEEIPKCKSEDQKNKLTEILELVNQTLYRLTIS